LPTQSRIASKMAPMYQVSIGSPGWATNQAVLADLGHTALFVTL